MSDKSFAETAQRACNNSSLTEKPFSFSLATKAMTGAETSEVMLMSSRLIPRYRALYLRATALRISLFIVFNFKGNGVARQFSKLLLW